MNSPISSLRQGILTGSWRIPLAIAAAAAMLLITEMAYQGQRSRLDKLVYMGRARLMLTYAVQRVTDAESGKRGYLLVGGRDYLEPYLQADKDVRNALLRIHELDLQSEVPGMAARQARLDKLMEEKLSEMQEVLRRHDSGHREAALDMVRTGIGREIMQRMRQEFDANLSWRNLQISQELHNISKLLLLGRIGIGAMTGLSLLILILFIQQGRTLSREREAQRKALVDERDKLEQEAEKRTRELRDLARHLQTAREDERARLARDLHDELGALLTTAKLDVAVIRPKVQQNLPDLLPKVTHLTQALNQGIALKRRIIEDLCPSSLRTLGLVASLEALLYETARTANLHIVQDLQAVSLSADDQLTVYRVVQEALTNTLKYAQAKQLTVRLREHEDWAIVEVQDDGRGFDTSAIKTGAHGLLGMRFRVEASAGELTLRSAPGQGTTVLARLPQSEALEGAIETAQDHLQPD